MLPSRHAPLRDARFLSLGTARCFSRSNTLPPPSPSRTPTLPPLSPSFDTSPDRSSSASVLTLRLPSSRHALLRPLASLQQRRWPPASHFSPATLAPSLSLLSLPRLCRLATLLPSLTRFIASGATLTLGSVAGSASPRSVLPPSSPKA
jgi:hypothetical protein